jgi:hypothetical protein
MPFLKVREPLPPPPVWHDGAFQEGNAPYGAKRIARKESGGPSGNGSQALALTPSMAARAEIATGDRWLIDFMLSPIAKANSEAGRER